ncbi:7984_t:CDS:2 [Ambispora gerdemannii]|uniref:7984_t:CDS:1 n=1 Tax=Ambispora gerdemannii TaxID=144530 RepID=A0A9N9CWK1_9GLOM|nr:7984_t:CDS:2 [Ambispora gerdemannii]
MPIIEEEMEDPIREKDHNIGNDINNGNNGCTSKDKTMEQLDTCPKLELNIQVGGDEFYQYCYQLVQQWNLDTGCFENDVERRDESH